MIVRNASPADIVHVVLTMRELSAAEAFASRAGDNRARLAEDMVAAADRAILVWALVPDGAEPAAIVGIDWTGPGRGGILFAANDGFPAIALSVHRWWFKRFKPEVLAKFRRVEFTGSAPDTASGRWLASLGFVCEGVARAYGKRGEDFGHWAWVNPNWLAAETATVDAAMGRIGSAGMHAAEGGALV